MHWFAFALTILWFCLYSELLSGLSQGVCNSGGSSETELLGSDSMFGINSRGDSDYGIDSYPGTDSGTDSSSGSGADSGVDIRSQLWSRNRLRSQNRPSTGIGLEIAIGSRIRLSSKIEIRTRISRFLNRFRIRFGFNLAGQPSWKENWKFS